MNLKFRMSTLCVVIVGVMLSVWTPVESVRAQAGTSSPKFNLTSSVSIRDYRFSPTGPSLSAIGYPVPGPMICILLEVTIGGVIQKINFCTDIITSFIVPPIVESTNGTPIVLPPPGTGNTNYSTNQTGGVITNVSGIPNAANAIRVSAISLPSPVTGAVPSTNFPNQWVYNNVEELPGVPAEVIRTNSSLGIHFSGSSVFQVGQDHTLRLALVSAETPDVKPENQTVVGGALVTMHFWKNNNQVELRNLTVKVGFGSVTDERVWTPFDVLASKSDPITIAQPDLPDRTADAYSASLDLDTVIGAQAAIEAARVAGKNIFFRQVLDARRY